MNVSESTFIQVFKMIWNVSYSLMTSFKIPGTSITPLTLTMTGLFIVTTWKIIKHFLGMGVDYGEYGE